MTRRQCGVPWAACQSCLGVHLEWSAGACRCPTCGRAYPEVDWAGPCRAPAAILLFDADGVSAPVCASHAESPRVAKWKRRRLVEGRQ